MFEIIFYGGILLIILFLLFILSMVWPPDSPWSPWWRTDKKQAKKILDLAKVTKKDVVYELGSGEAVTLITAAKDYHARGVGIEIEISRYYLSKLKIWKNGVNKEVRVIRGNFFKEDLSEATVIFVYLVPKTLNRLLPKFKNELKKGTRIVSLKYEMKLPVKKIDKENELKLYII